MSTTIPRTQATPDDIKAPEIYYCDFSHQLMRDPVISIHGYTFDRAAILKWLALGNNFCPCSGKDMTMQDLISARNLKLEINTWRAEHGLPSDIIIGMTLVIKEENDQDEILLHDVPRISCPDETEKVEEFTKELTRGNSRLRIIPFQRMVRKVLRVHPSS